MAKKEESSPTKRKKWSKGPKQPVVFMFQPDEYEAVPSKKLRQWEEDMVKRVGFPAELVAKMVGGGHETFTFYRGEYVD